MKAGVIEAAIFNSAPVCGFLPVRAALSLVSKVPNPIKETFSFFTNSSETIFTKALIAASESFLERPVCYAIAFTNSALFIIFTPFDK